VNNLLYSVHGRRDSLHLNGPAYSGQKGEQIAVNRYDIDPETINAIFTVGFCSTGYTAAAGSHKLVNLYLDAGNPGTTLNAGSNLVSTESVECPSKAKTCTLALSAMDQICGAGGSGADLFEISVTVDGTPVDGGEGVSMDTGIDTPPPCMGGNWSDIATVTAGSHTIELFTTITQGNYGGTPTQGQ
jgi:hypothetical protein